MDAQNPMIYGPMLVIIGGHNGAAQRVGDKNIQRT
jgi:hypothetical protein